jgi:metal-responsive CopG/Arc/MetJ family transcriptional regulator
MQIIELKLDDALLAEVDRAVLSLSMTREDFARIALEMAVRNQRRIALEKRHAEGYAPKPMNSDKIEEWEPEQVWT